MIEVKDEILSGEPLYRIRDKNGNILLDNVTIEMITPVIQQPTSINKQLFETVAKQNRFYKTSSISNITPVSFSNNIIPALSSNSSEGYTAMSSEEFDRAMIIGSDKEGDVSDYAYVAFDSNTSTFIQRRSSLNKTCYITLNTPLFIKPTQCYIKQLEENIVNVYGKEKDGTWTLLGDLSLKEGNIELSSNRYYSGFKFEFPDYGDSDCVYEIQITAGEYITEDEAKNLFTIEPEIALSSYAEGLKFNIEIPNDYSAISSSKNYIKVGILELVELDLNLVAGKRYSIVYDGEKFIAV